MGRYISLFFCPFFGPVLKCWQCCNGLRFCHSHLMDCLVILHISFLNSEVWTFENSTRSITHLICLDFSLPGGELKQKISKIYFEPRHPGGDAPPCCRLQGPAGSPFPPGFFHFNFLQVFFTSWSIQCHLLLDKFSTELDVTSSVLPGGRPRLQGRFNHHPSRLQ